MSFRSRSMRNSSLADDAISEAEGWQPQGFDRKSRPVQMRQASGITGEAVVNHVEQRHTAKTNTTGLPDTLKTGVEQLSGLSMDDVKVHYNSAKPKTMGALAYAQGNTIHMGPGQEQHLPHEAWHVVQQKQGRVAPTKQMEKTAYNDDAVLEREADVMGARAASMGRSNSVAQPKSVSSVGVAQKTAQFKFEKDTTFGLEIEFKNRWVSACDHGKGLKEIDAVGSGLKGWKSGTDRGRGVKGSKICGTVLEYESAVYNSKQMKDGTMDAAVKTAMAKSVDNANAVRQANSVKVVVAESNARGEDAKSIELNSEQIKANHFDAPKATLQITTLGRGTDAHVRTLHDVSDAIDLESEIQAKSTQSIPDEIVDLLMTAKTKAHKNVDLLWQNAKTLKSKEDKQVMEDLEAVTSALTQSLVFLEGGLGGAGTIKNMVDPMPRRIIAPPKGGFMKRLNIDSKAYFTVLDSFSKSVVDLSDEIGEHTDVLCLLGWFASGAKDGGAVVGEAVFNDENDKPALYDLTVDDLMFWADRKVKVKDRPSLWHDIAGSNPTLEADIIKSSGKKNPEEWTSHEIRNSLFSTAMTPKQMKVFTDIVAKYIKD